VDADADVFETRFDGLSRTLSTHDPEGNQVHLTYDQNNNLLETREVETSPLITNPEEFVTEQKYDSLNRLVQMIEPNTVAVQITIVRIPKLSIIRFEKISGGFSL
jgi:YD repeat-containing protein